MTAVEEEPCPCGGPPTEIMGDDSVMFATLREVQKVEVIARFCLDGEPVSKARARFTNYGSRVRTYTPAKTKTAEEAVACKFRQAAPGHVPDSTHSYGVCAVFFPGTRQRRDVDNMLKLILDGLNKVAWHDDVQVDEVSGRRGRDLPENARTEVLVYRLGITPRPQRVCEQCGVRFDTYASWSKKKYCTQACGMAARAAARVRTCENCGAKFTSTHLQNPPRYCGMECHNQAGRVDLVCVHCGSTYSKHKSTAAKGKPLCSDECRAAYWREHRTSNAKGVCVDCGGATSKKQYQRCRGCGLAYRAAQDTELPAVSP